MMSMRSSAKKHVSPLLPPNPPTLTLPAGIVGAEVLPAIDVITSCPCWSNAEASNRASLVPPRIRTRLATADDLAVTAYDQYIGLDGRSLQHLAHRAESGLRHTRGQVETKAAGKLLDLLGGIGLARLVASPLRHEPRKPAEVHLASLRV